ncbi:MAG TPA: efflux RND transporter periplasmic adaptor subunit [Prolixibacteraceae bacterium]|nr:efflux RND transporter periplasmic adaptor subunit [Prolixibacteraceae bacterium]
MLKKKKYLILIAVLTVIGIAVLISFQIKPSAGKFYKVKKGDLEVIVNAKGEVKGENFTEINLPDAVCDQELRVYQLKIMDVILEGKAVKKGDYIAKLDEGQLVTMMRDNMQQKEKMDADLRNVVLDSTVTLSERREAVVNAKLDLQYLQIDLDQSKYESEAYQRKTQMQYQKAENEIDKIGRNYLLEKNRLKIQVVRYQSRVAEFQDKIKKYQEALVSTTIKAPEDGIVMFAKDWMGKTYGKDSEINIWRPLIATLPDMSVVISETYIREIDIAKVQLNDSVRINIDALPDKVFLGKIIKIATIGEDHKDFDMKAFKVIIRFDKSDKEMKPGMSANNDIIIDSYRDKLLLPLKTVFSKNGKQIVYLKRGGDITEQEIEMVAENEEFGVVENGIKEGDVVLLYQPEEFKLEGEKVANR